MDMDDIRGSFSKLKKGLKHRMRGRKHKPDRAGVNTAMESIHSSGSLLRPEPHVAAGGDYEDGSGTSTDGRQAISRDRSPQPEPMPTGGDDNKQRREAGVDEKEVSQSHSRLDPNVNVTTESGPSQDAERVSPPPTPSIPQSGRPDNDAETSVVPRHVSEDLRPNESAESGAAANENRSNWRATAFATTKLLLRGVRDSGDFFGPLKSVAGGLCFILENCERTKANEQSIKSLGPRVGALTELLCEPVPETDTEEGERREKLKQRFKDIHRDLAPLEEQGNVEGFFNNVKNAEKLGGLVEDVRDAIMEYQTSLQQYIYKQNSQLIQLADLALLNGMRRATGAGYLGGDRQRCLKGTRKGVLGEIESWLAGKQDHRVFWLNGLAGTGKSTIAQSFAEMAFADGKLGASFFCSRDFEDRSNLRMIFPTLAFQLAYQYPHFRKELVGVLVTHPDVGQESLCSQMEKLIVGPLKAASISTLIIIDALDECKDEEPASAILSILSRHVNEIPGVKFFITGRPETRIRSGFRLEALVPITEVLKLHDVKPEAVDSDIKLFFRIRLGSLAKDRSNWNLTEDWPSTSDIEILCRKAAGFFIYASTVVKFVDSETDLPDERLMLITSLPRATAREGKFGVDQLYTQVLQQAFKIHKDESHYSRFRTVVGTVLLILNPLSVDGLSELLGHSTSHILGTVRSLHSLLLVPVQMEDPILTFHKSFPDFLMDPDRCEDKCFLVEPTVYHTEILLSCLRLMRKKLKKNICGLDVYAVLSEVKDLPTRQKDHIGDALEYACRFWTRHLLGIPSSSPHAEEVKRAIDQFFTKHLLYWIEVLALTGNLGAGVYAMNDVEQWCTAAGFLCKWTNDSQRFLLEYFDMIHDSPFHIYHSALPFSPSSSLLQEHYNTELSTVKVVKGLSTEWGTCCRTVSLDNWPESLSCWSNLSALGFRSGNIIILDVITGSQAAVLSGHTGWVNTLTFSSDGTSLASGSEDTTIKLWDVQTGGIVKTFCGHTNNVFSVSISADCTRIASGSSDNTIYLWDIQTGKCHCVIQQYDFVYNVCFFPKAPQHLLSISNGKVWQWDADGCQVGPTYDGSLVAFSPDGAQFISCVETAATIRDSSSGVIVAEFQVAKDTQHCCFSPSSKHIAVAAANTAYVWDISHSNPSLIGTFAGHDSEITSLRFSSSSSLISASSWDKSVKFWQIGTPDPVIVDSNSASSTLAPIKSTTLQMKDNIIIASDTDGVVKIWDISTGLCRASFQTPLKGASQRDVQLINGRLTFVWYADGKINVWDTEKGKLLLVIDGPKSLKDLKISRDISGVLCLTERSIQAWSLQTGEVMGEVEARSSHFLIVDGSRVWGCDYHSGYKGWDFGIPGSAPVQLSSIPPCRLHPSGAMLWDVNLPGIRDKETGKVVFQLPKRYGIPFDAQWDGQYLVACFTPPEVLTLDFSHVTLK